MRWTEQDLAQAVADGRIRISPSNSPQKAGERKDRQEQEKRPEPQAALKEPIKKRKYGNEPTVVEGITFHSKREASRYGELRVLERARVITGLDMQVKYPLVVNGVLIANYYADFTYSENGQFIVEDSKGFRTKEYRLKKKLVKAIWGYDIRET